MARFTAFLLVLAAAAFAVSEATCYNRCRFRFCNGKSKFYLPAKPDRAFTGKICSRWGNRVIGHVDSTGEARVVLRHRKTVRISKWHPWGLKQKFSSSFFKSYNVHRYYKGRKIAFSGIGHEVPQQNQRRFLKNRCFFVPLTAYQVLNRKGNVVANRHPRNAHRDCVAFKTH